MKVQRKGATQFTLECALSYATPRLSLTQTPSPDLWSSGSCRCSKVGVRIIRNFESLNLPLFLEYSYIISGFPGFADRQSHAAPPHDGKLISGELPHHKKESYPRCWEEENLFVRCRCWHINSWSQLDFRLWCLASCRCLGEGHGRGKHFTSWDVTCQNSGGVSVRWGFKNI